MTKEEIKYELKKILNEIEEIPELSNEYSDEDATRIDLCLTSIYEMILKLNKKI